MQLRTVTTLYPCLSQLKPLLPLLASIDKKIKEIKMKMKNNNQKLKEKEI